MRKVVIATFVLSLLSASALTALFMLPGYVRQDMALDLVEACADQNGASGVCTITYDMVGTFLIIQVGDTQVYCHSGTEVTC